MKLIGIDINSAKVVFYCVEVLADGSIKELASNFKSLAIKDDHQNYELRDFQAKAFGFFDSIQPTKITILKRMTKGKFAASSVSFKLEGLMQCYTKCEIDFIAPATLNAFFKKNEFTLLPPNKYQTNAARLVQFLI